MPMLLIRAGSRASYKRLDTNANAFVTAAAITDRAQKAAANHYVRSFKFYGLWTKSVGLYPFLGGTAAAHKFNLINPVDNDAAFRMAFNGTWTHDNTGAIPVSSAYGDTKINADSNLPGNNVHVALAGHNNGSMISASVVEAGAQVGSTIQPRIGFGLKAAGNLYVFDCYQGAGGSSIRIANNSAFGFLGIASRIASNSSAYYSGDMLAVNLAPSNLNTIGTNPANSAYSFLNANVTLNGLNSANINTAARIYTFFSVGTSFTQQNAADLYRIVWYANRVLGRIGT
jgi:hypothetical protein